MRRIWVLGAPDPEMECIEELLRECGESVVYATDGDGKRVHPGNAYRCPIPEVPENSTVYAVECIGGLPEGWVRIDHHRPGDPGYGRPPAEFLPASSIGQVIAELARLGLLSSLGWPEKDTGTPTRDRAGTIRSDRAWRIRGDAPCVWDAERRTWSSRAGELWCGDHSSHECTHLDWWVITHAMPLRERAGDCILTTTARGRFVPTQYVLAAAADHCLAAAYRGECPGVDPEELLCHRAEQKARFQGRSVEDVLEDIEAASEDLLDAQPLWCVRILEHRRVVENWEYDRVRNGLRPDPDTWYRRRAEALDAVVVPKALEDVLDLRDYEVAELPEAASREGVAYLTTVTDRDGREKVVLGGCTTPEMVRAFMEHWAPGQGLVDIYGDPARGFAGAYLP